MNYNEESVLIQGVVWQPKVYIFYFNDVFFAILLRIKEFECLCGIVVLHLLPCDVFDRENAGETVYSGRIKGLCQLLKVNFYVFSAFVIYMY